MGAIIIDYMTVVIFFFFFLEIKFFFFSFYEMLNFLNKQSRYTREKVLEQMRSCLKLVLEPSGLTALAREAAPGSARLLFQYDLGADVIAC